MSTRRHINLSLLSMERELADSLDNEEIIALFNSKPRRLRLVYSFYAGLPNSRTDTRVFYARCGKSDFYFNVYLDCGLWTGGVRSGTVAVQGTILYDLTV